MSFRIRHEREREREIQLKEMEKICIFQKRKIISFLKRAKWKKKSEKTPNLMMSDVDCCRLKNT